MLSCAKKKHKASIFFRSYQPKSQLIERLTPNLTDRQAEMLRLIARGLSNKEVMEELHMTYRPFYDHLKKLWDEVAKLENL